MKERTAKWLRLTMILAPCLALPACSSGDADGDESATANRLPTSVTTADGVASSPPWTATLEELEKQMAEHSIPGASIAVVQNGQLAFQAGAGVKAAGGDDLVTATTLFSAASLSKMVLAATVMKLVEQGKLDLSQPVTDYVPLKLAAPFDPRAVTLHQLLTHTSGIPDLEISTTSCAVGPGQEAAWFGAHADEPLWTPPGQVWNYSSRGYAILGWVVEAITGAPYEVAATSLVLGPAGMTTATFDPGVARAADPALGHAVDSQNGRLVTHEPAAVDCAVDRPSSGVIASAVDYAHFAEMLLQNGGAALSASSVAAMETPHVDTDAFPGGAEHYGYGLETLEYQGVHLIRHEGDLGFGYRSSLWMVPDRQLAVVVFYNALGGAPASVTEYAIRAFLGIDGSSPKFTTLPSSWGVYTGTYVDPFDLGTVTVSLGEGQLLASAPSLGAVAVPMKQVAGDRFGTSFDGDDTSVTFYPGPSGPAEWLVTRKGVARRQ